jgi:phage repressor protein C with HTH and peptisase S24 domain
METGLKDNDRLRELFKGKRRVEFVRETNFSGGTSMVSQHLSGNRPISLLAAKQYAEWLGVTVRDISPSIADQLDELNSTVENAGSVAAFNLTSANNDDAEGIGKIVYWDVRGSCGGGFLNDVQMPKGTLIKEESFFRKHALKPQNAFAIYADGDSMAEFIVDGDIVIFDKSKTTPSSGKIFAIEHPAGLRIKVLRRMIDGTWVLESKNPDKRSFPDEVIPPEQSDLLKIYGQFVYRQGG